MESECSCSLKQRDCVLYASVVQIGHLSIDVISNWLSEGKLEHHLLLLVDDGRAKLERGNEIPVLFADSCWLLLPGERVRIREDGEKRLQGRIVVFDVWCVGQTEDEETGHAGKAVTMQPVKFPVSGMLESHLTDELRRWAEENERIGKTKNGYQEFSLSVRFLAILLKIWQTNEEHLHSQVALEAIQKTIALMEQSYARQLTRNELAKLANMSPSHYSFVFKREIGKSPMEKLTEIRIHHAKKQLLFSDRKLRDIAASVGYRNEFYFSRQFKQLVGVSPTVFASQHFAKHATVSHPFPLHLQSLGLEESYSSNGQGDTINVVGLYVEDFLISLGIKPVLKCVGNNFRQRYLNAYLSEVEEWSILSFDFSAIESARPDLIILGHPSYGDHERFARFSEIAPTYSIRKGLHNWKEGIRIIGQLLNRLPQAESIIAYHGQFLDNARVRLETVSNQTVELIRICNDRHIRLYGGPGGYTGTVLYQDLGLNPSASVLQRAWDKPYGYATITPDEVFDSQADHLFVVVDPAGAPYWSQLAKDPRWSKLRSVRESRCYEVRFDIWMTFGIIAHRLKVQDVLHFLVPAELHHANNSV